MNDFYDSADLAIEHEIIRLQNNLRADDFDSSLYIFSYIVCCYENIDRVLQKAKEVLLIIDKTLINRTKDPTINEWNILLPKWFISKCKPEKTEKEKQEYIEWWESLTNEEKLEQSKLPQIWSLSNWIYYFDIDLREWYWWKYEVLDLKTSIVYIEVRGHPFPSGSFDWLLRASGAYKVEEIED